MSGEDVSHAADSSPGADALGVVEVSPTREDPSAPIKEHDERGENSPTDTDNTRNAGQATTGRDATARDGGVFSVTPPRDEDEWTGAIFDPELIRHFSLLPDEDADEAYCVRHDRDMRAIDPVVHTQGALYTTADGFSVYTCPRCRAEIDRQVEREDGGLKAYRLALTKAFDRWDRGDAPGDWFRYLGEGTIEDFDEGRAFVAFGGVSGGGSA